MHQNCLERKPMRRFTPMVALLACPGVLAVACSSGGHSAVTEVSSTTGPGVTAKLTDASSCRPHLKLVPRMRAGMQDNRLGDSTGVRLKRDRGVVPAAG